MPEVYQPRKLPRNREYPGYQFYCTVEKEGSDASGCFCFVVLCVIDWLKGRLRETGMIPVEISSLPGRERFGKVSVSDFLSFTVSSGFSAYVVSLPGHGIWTLRLKEPDSDTEQRKAVPGRFFATNVGIRMLDDRRVELGIRIDVTDPEGIPEVGFAFRPAFVRYLFATEGLVLSQGASLPYDKAVIVENEEQMTGLRAVLDSSEWTLPLVLITQGIRLPKEEPASLFNRVSFSPVMPVAAKSPSGASANLSPGINVGFSAVVSSPFSASPAGAVGAGFAGVPVLEQYYPFDADEIASHGFGYAYTCRVSEKVHGSLAKRLKKDYAPGDILFVEPKRYGGNVKAIGKEEKDVPGLIKQWTRSYSKHRKYSFGDVQFEFDARNLEQREIVERIRASSELKAEEKLAELNKVIEQLQDENEKRVRKINELKEQLLSEFERGEAAEKLRTDQLLEDYDRHEDEIRQVRARNLQLEQENREARCLKNAVETLRDLPEMPQSTEDVVFWFRNVFGDRVAFTERGLKSACKCDIRPDGLWYYLYHIATSLFEIHHGGSTDVEKDFYHATGIEVAMNEGSQSHKDSKVMNQRADVFEGKEISIEPHVKLLPAKTGADFQRIYYCYDHELDLIIIGSVGEHLKTAGTTRI